jgi:hypothetical protein
MTRGPLQKNRGIQLPDRLQRVRCALAMQNDSLSIYAVNWQSVRKWGSEMSRSRSTRKVEPKSDMVDFGRGQFITKDEMAERARYQFLLSIRAKCPAPLFELRDKLFPQYRDWVDSVMREAQEDEAWSRTPEADKDRKAWEQLFLKMGTPATVAKIAAQGRPVQGTAADDPMFTHFMLFEDVAPKLDRHLKEWAQSFGLTHTREFEEDLRATGGTAPGEDGEVVFVEQHLYKQYWACQWALDTLWRWRFHDAGPAMMTAHPPEWVRVQFRERSLYPITGGLPQVTLNERAWNPAKEEPTDFREHIHRVVDAFLDTYIEIAAEGMGVVKTPRKRREHFDWLALFQVTPAKLQEIAAKYNVEPQTVSDGIKSAAEMIGLRPRRGGRGPEAGKTPESIP